MYVIVIYTTSGVIVVRGSNIGRVSEARIVKTCVAILMLSVLACGHVLLDQYSYVRNTWRDQYSYVRNTWRDQYSYVRNTTGMRKK